MEIPKDTLHDILNTIPAVLYEYVLYKDGSSEFLYMSPTARDILGHPPQFFVEDMSRFWAMVHPEDINRLQNDDTTANAGNVFFVSDTRIVLSSEEHRWIRLSSRPTSKTKNGAVIWCGYITDITAQKQAEAELKILRGILPLCSFCKKIRDDKGYWEQVDVYISKYSEVDISHGICPECMQVNYPEEYALIKRDGNEE